MFTKSNSLWAVLLALVTMSGLTLGRGREWKLGETVGTDQLAKELSSKAGPKPLIIQVGFEFLFQGGHIPGSIWAGPASRVSGITSLKNAVKDVPRNRKIIIYCGCCPWSECPNILPAFDTLKKLGFRSVKALLIPVNFEHDWISKGYPTVTSGRKNKE